MHVHRALAQIVLVGTWSVSEIARRVATALRYRKPTKWLNDFSGRVVAEFGSEPPPPSQFRLARFISFDRALGRITTRLLGEDSETPSCLNVLQLPKPEMSPARKLSTAGALPKLTTPGELARWLEISPGELDWFADCFGGERLRRAGPLRHYRYLWLSKRSGRKRLLESPKLRLKNFQKKILDEILVHVPLHAAAHAFRAGSSTLTCAAPHLGQRVVLRIDLRDFFPSIRSGRVLALFRTIGYPEAVARLLTGLCTNSVPTDVLADGGPATNGAASRKPFEIPHLPQGAPTSPALANLCAFRLDCRLAGLARRMGIRYTRYADDLIFSGDRQFERSLPEFRVLVCAIVIDEGFSIRRRKTRVMRSGRRQEVTGLVVNRRINVARDEFDRLKAILHNCVASGPR
ncbi:MAG TPA: reverse transcriptase family protein, partial [Planctomycetaceae bacterium]|nr:reverse transcriptase family protein [Planctomycetaceae bacterium]